MKKLKLLLITAITLICMMNHTFASPNGDEINIEIDLSKSTAEDFILPFVEQIIAINTYVYQNLINITLVTPETIDGVRVTDARISEGSSIFYRSRSIQRYSNDRLTISNATLPDPIYLKLWKDSPVEVYMTYTLADGRVITKTYELRFGIDQTLNDNNNNNNNNTQPSLAVTQEVTTNAQTLPQLKHVNSALKMGIKAGFDWLIKRRTLDQSFSNTLVNIPSKDARVKVTKIAPSYYIIDKSPDGTELVLLKDRRYLALINKKGALILVPSDIQKIIQTKLEFFFRKTNRHYDFVDDYSRLLYNNVRIQHFNTGNAHRYIELQFNTLDVLIINFGPNAITQQQLAEAYPHHTVTYNTHRNNTTADDDEPQFIFLEYFSPSNSWGKEAPSTSGGGSSNFSTPERLLPVRIVRDNMSDLFNMLSVDNIAYQGHYDNVKNINVLTQKLTSPNNIMDIFQNNDGFYELTSDNKLYFTRYTSSVNKGFLNSSPYKVATALTLPNNLVPAEIVSDAKNLSQDIAAVITTNHQLILIGSGVNNNNGIAVLQSSDLNLLGAVITQQDNVTELVAPQNLNNEVRIRSCGAGWSSVDLPIKPDNLNTFIDCSNPLVELDLTSRIQ